MKRLYFKVCGMKCILPWLRLEKIFSLFLCVSFAVHLKKKRQFLIKRKINVVIHQTNFFSLLKHPTEALRV